MSNAAILRRDAFDRLIHIKGFQDA